MNNFKDRSLLLFNLEGKRALVTGGTQGIGYAIAKGLGEAGASVVINARNMDRLDQCVQELRASGLDVSGSLFDVTDSEMVQNTIASIESDMGPIDILVNNAGIIKRAQAEDLEERDWDIVIQTNLTAPFIVS